MMSRRLRASDLSTSSGSASSPLADSSCKIRQRVPLITNAHVLAVFLAMIQRRPKVGAFFCRIANTPTKAHCAPSIDLSHEDVASVFA